MLSLVNAFCKTTSDTTMEQDTRSRSGSRLVSKSELPKVRYLYVSELGTRSV